MGRANILTRPQRRAADGGAPRRPPLEVAAPQRPGPGRFLIAAGIGHRDVQPHQLAGVNLHLQPTAARVVTTWMWREMSFREKLGYVFEGGILDWRRATG